MLRVDENAVKIVERLKRAHEDWCKEVNPCESIFLLFAHDFVRHFSGILLHREAKEEYSDSVQFPLITRKYARYPYRLDEFDNVQQSVKKDLKSAVRQFGLSKVALGQGVPIDKKYEWTTGKWMNLVGTQKPFVQAFFPKREIQIQALQGLIHDVAKEFEIPQVDAVLGNWNQHIELHTTSKQPVISLHGVIVGTRNNLQNRKLAVNYLQQRKEVVAITHGEVANSVMDEPPFGYSERTLCSVLVDYGDYDKDGFYNAPWVMPRRRIYRDGVVANKVFEPNSDIRFPGSRAASGLYIPTIHHGNTLYGPFHAFEDIKYREWQLKVCSLLENVTFKVHPKSRSGPIVGVPLENRSLEICIKDYDYLVFDYFATGAMLGLVTDKPVIYCDIGLRKLHPDFLYDLKNRCEYVKIDLENLDKSYLATKLSEALSSQKSFSNEGIKKYVFCKSDKFSWKEIFLRLNSGKSLSSG